MSKTSYIISSASSPPTESINRPNKAPRWVLASGSPRRQSLLKQLGFSFEVIPSQVDEYIKPHELPRDFALRMALEKAQEVASRESLTSNNDELYVIGGDTVVALGHQALGKPNDSAHAVQMLSELSGRSHDVWSGWAVARVDSGQTPMVICSGVSRGVVKMRESSPEERLAYVESGEPLDKAGSYGIQGLGGRFVEQLKGSLYGVIGIPIQEISEALSTRGLLPYPEFARRSIMLRERAATAAWRSGRSVDEVNVLAVSKRHPAEQLIVAGGHDLHHFGESYLQELTEKRPQVINAWPELREKVAHVEAEPRWHYIGKIQTNKAKQIGAQAGWVHGVSRLTEAKRLAEGARQAGHTLRVMLQVNIAGESQKGGVTPDQTKTLLDACRELSGLEVVGLMTFPPLADPEESRVHFRALRALRDQLAEPHAPLPHLSMGTSHDFEVAIEEGATWVRLGRSLFGERS